MSPVAGLPLLRKEDMTKDAKRPEATRRYPKVTTPEMVARAMLAKRPPRPKKGTPPAGVEPAPSR